MALPMVDLIWLAFWQTILMVILSCFFAVLFGLPLGVLLYATKHRDIFKSFYLHQTLAWLINFIRSIPFIILMVAIIPFTRLIVGTSIGTEAAIVPLTLAAIPFVARLVEAAMEQVPHGVIEASLSMGATSFQILYHVVLPESLPVIVKGITLTLITLVGYSAMAGAIGGGGLGDIAIQYGYERFDIKTMLVTVVLIALLVQILQMAGDSIEKDLSHQHKKREVRFYEEEVL